MKKIALLLVLFTSLHLLPKLSIMATAYVHEEQANKDASEKPRHIGFVDHISAGRGGSAPAGGGRGGSSGGGRGSGRGSRGGTGVHPFYPGGGAIGHKRSAAATNHRSFGVGLNAMVVIVLATISLTV